MTGRKSHLTAAEREVICTIADHEQAWSVFTDSARHTRRILRVAAQWGVTPERHGAGWRVPLPFKAIRIVGPRRVTPRQREHLVRLQNGRNDSRQPIRMRSARGSARQNDSDIGPSPDRPKSGHSAGGSGR